MCHRDGWQFIVKKEEGAVLGERMWLIPADAEKPDDPRRVRKMNKLNNTF